MFGDPPLTLDGLIYYFRQLLFFYYHFLAFFIKPFSICIFLSLLQFNGVQTILASEDAAGYSSFSSMNTTLITGAVLSRLSGFVDNIKRNSLPLYSFRANHDRSNAKINETLTKTTFLLAYFYDLCSDLLVGCCAYQQEHHTDVHEKAILSRINPQSFKKTIFLFHFLSYFSYRRWIKKYS